MHITSAILVFGNFSCFLERVISRLFSSSGKPNTSRLSNPGPQSNENEFSCLNPNPNLPPFLYSLRLSTMHRTWLWISSGQKCKLYDIKNNFDVYRFVVVAITVFFCLFAFNSKRNTAHQCVVFITWKWRCNVA